ncbi:hypothetical protein [Amycolatopsis sp. NPDC059021]|uniref:hypothetical protein n=1 Tax=Amycolatopsis sp. NPDC059021 TaxID=3346704 RepID=UPI00366CE36D
MSSTEDGARPAGARRVQPPRWVTVDLPRLFPLPDRHRRTNTPAGLQTGHEITGELVGWARNADGAWLALVRYQLHTADEKWQTTFTHYMPAHLVQPVSLVRRRRESWRG